MSGMDELVQKLQGEPKTVEKHLQEEKASWEADLAALVSAVKKWLQTGVDRGVFVVEDHGVELDEVDVGTYRAPGLKIQIPTKQRQVTMTPQGFRIQGVTAFGGRRELGIRGRVDLSSGPAKVLLLRRARAEADQLPWDVLMSTGSKRPLDEDVFAEVLDYLVG